MRGVCPHCRQNAPIVYRGVTATCTACGRPRMPLTSSSVNLAGQPSQLGGRVARGFGWATLAGGWSTALLFAGVLYAIFGLVPAVWIVGGFLAAVSSLVAWVLLRSGKELVVSGEQSEQATKTQALVALAATRGGTVTAWDAAQALAITPEEADALLTRLAKEQLDLVKVDIDDEGRVLYRFTQATWANLRPPPPMRVEAPAPRMRVDPRTGVRVPDDGRALEEEPLEEAEEARRMMAQPSKAR